MNYSEADEINKEDLEAAAEKLDEIKKKVSLFETFTVDINGHYVNYNTNRSIFAYKKLFLIMSSDLDTVLKILYPSEAPLDEIRHDISDIQMKQRNFKNAKGSINTIMKIERCPVKSFHKEMSTLHPDTVEGSVFKDAYGTYLGILKIEEKYVNVVIEGNAFEVRKDVLGLLQRINQHSFQGMSEAFKLKEQENETTISN